VANEITDTIRNGSAGPGPSPSAARVVDAAVGQAFVDALYVAVSAVSVAGIASAAAAILAALFIHHRPAH
jgi:hypothetical protein